MIRLENTPWLGLASYTSQDANRFFGRDKEIEVVTNAIRRHYCTIIYGKSGTGKTSLIQAGITPAMMNDRYLPISFKLDHSQGHQTYSQQIVDAVTRAIAAAEGEVESLLTPHAAQLVPEEYKLWTFFHTNDFWSSDNYQITPVIFIDQFEELFTLNANCGEVTAFFGMIQDLLRVIPQKGLSEALMQGDEQMQYKEVPQFRIILSLREDFLPRLEDHSYHIPELRKNRIGVAALDGNQAMEVMLKPTNSPISRPVAIEILSKLCHKPVMDSPEQLVSLKVETCILSLFCSELYVRTSELRKDTIDSDMVKLLGDDIIQSFYKRSVKGISQSSLLYLEDHLLTAGGYRNALAIEDIVPQYVKQSEIDMLEKRRIIRKETLNGAVRIEFTHDVLCSVAKTNRNRRTDRSLKIRKWVAASWSFMMCFLWLIFIVVIATGSRPNHISNWISDATITTGIAIVTLLGILMVQTASLIRHSHSWFTWLILILTIFGWIPINAAISEENANFTVLFLASAIGSVLVFLFELTSPYSRDIKAFGRSLLNKPFLACAKVIFSGLFINYAYLAIVTGDQLCRNIMFVSMAPMVICGVVWMRTYFTHAVETEVWLSYGKKGKQGGTLRWLTLVALAIVLPVLILLSDENQNGTVYAIGVEDNYLTIVEQEGKYGVKEGDRWILPPLYAEINKNAVVDTTQEGGMITEVTFHTKLVEMQLSYDDTKASDFMMYRNAVTDALASCYKMRQKDPLRHYFINKGDITLTSNPNSIDITPSMVDDYLAEYGGFQHSSIYKGIALHDEVDSLRTKYAMRSLLFGIGEKVIADFGVKNGYTPKAKGLVPLLMIQNTKKIDDICWYLNLDINKEYLHKLLQDTAIVNSIAELTSETALYRDALNNGTLPTRYQSYAYDYITENLDLLGARIDCYSQLAENLIEVNCESDINHAYYHIFLGKYVEAEAESLSGLEHENSTLAATNLLYAYLLQDKFAEADSLTTQWADAYYTNGDYLYRWPDLIAMDLYNYHKTGMIQKFTDDQLRQLRELMKRMRIGYGISRYKASKLPWEGLCEAILWNGSHGWVKNDFEMADENDFEDVCAKFDIDLNSDMAERYQDALKEVEMSSYNTMADGEIDVEKWCYDKAIFFSDRLTDELTNPYPDCYEKIDNQDHALLYLILTSKSLETHKDKQEWIDLYSTMNEKNKKQLYALLIKERHILAQLALYDIIREMSKEGNKP